MYEIMTPGPTQVRENVLAARSLPCTNPDLDPDFYTFYKETCELISSLLRTKNEALILGGEGILGLEAACAGLTEPGDRVLAIDNGVFGKGFAQSGGVAGAVMRVLEEENADIAVSCKKCTGAKECKKALMILNAGRLPESIIEGMACEGGCIDGPASLLPHQKVVKNRDKLLKNADERTITENLIEHDFARVNME